MMRQRIIFDKKQWGASLLVSLIMLLVLTLLVVSGIRMSSTNLKIVGNMQAKNEATAAAQQAIEQVMGDLNNFYPPLIYPLIPPQTDPTIPVDINNDGVDDYTVTTSAAVCLKLVPVQGYSASFAASAPKDTYWDIKAIVTDSRTGATATVHQGAKVRLDSTATCT